MLATAFPAGRRVLGAAALLLGLTSYARAQSIPDVPSTSRYRATAIGINPLGWDAPYGFGLEVSHFVTHRLDLNAGAGISLSGTKVGVGLRYFTAPERRVSPYFGLNVVQSGGWRELEISEGGGDDWYEGDGEVTTVLTVKPTTLVHLRTGLRWQPGQQPGRVGLIGTIGYGLRVSGNPMQYDTVNYPEPDNVTQTLHRFFYAPGGLEMSLGLSIGLGQKVR
jgi:hypothetical protein